MKIKSHSVQSRCQNWGRWTQMPRKIEASSSSPFGRIAEDKNAAGSHGEGIRYEIVDGVACPPDGGLAREMEHKSAAWAYDYRCREVDIAINLLPAGMRRILRETYVVPPREFPRSASEVARRLDLHRKTVTDALEAAHVKIAREIFGPFVVV